MGEFVERVSKCDYHDLPLVCSICGHDRDARSGHAVIGWEPHLFIPVHRIEDPEDIEGTVIMPCPL
jgi:hypothetical protein